ncbi:HEAT repeat-containing protein 3 [Trachymyrmex septentrionalis]|uniref:HEAT repeat-containing protein 3 n=1 Tax=Trachymyrmex septentrionalis TaxID=34720 RepID=A0A195FKD3_9HYME|nr:PREDICTED: HEAT repeat-containing protein 3 [Trachymyrmex septentrionalis]KYN40722.1 HEAT repeat-containing protein 3 [Trachymyrmex septentrionalis]
MGKQKQHRRKLHKENPTGLQSVQEFDKELDEELGEGDREKILQNVYNDIQSCNLEEKLSALQILASISCDSSMVKHIAKDGIAKIIGPLLLDHNAAIQMNTAHTLREIAENGKEEVCNDLVKDDIITPLTVLLRQYYSDWKPEEVRDKKVTFVQAVSLLRILCANDESAIKRVNDEDLVSLLIKFLNIDVYGPEIVTIVTQSLICLSDENDAAINKIKQSESLLSTLLDLKADDKTASKILFLKTCVADVLINISNYTDNNRIHVFHKVLSILSDVLAIDHGQILSCLTSILPHESNASSNNKRKKVQENREILEMQEQALQILANLCFECEDNEIDSDTDDFETMELESECLDDDSMNEDLKITSTLPVELVEVINTCSLIDKIWDKSKFVVDKNNQEILDQTEEGKATLKQFYNIQSTAYLCLNNLLPNIEIDAFGGVDNLFRKWINISTEFKQIIKKDVELAEASTAAMRAILQRLVQEQANVVELNQLTCNDIQLMLNDLQQCVSINVSINMIRMLCNLVQIMLNKNNSKDSKNYEAIKLVSTFLLDISKTETRAWVIAESIDALMDIYAEDETDHLAADIKLVPRLLSIMPHFKSKMHQQKKHLQDSTVVVSTVNANLMRFIKYKQKRIGIKNKRI